MSEQYKRLRCMRNVAIPTIVVSVVCIGVGVATIIQSKPHYYFASCLGGGIVAGLSSLLAAYCNIRLYKMYVSVGGEPDDHRWKVQMVFVGTFLLLALICGLGISGIWCMVEITDSIKAPELFPSEENSERAECGRKTLGYGITTFVLVFVLWILKCIAYCACQNYYDDVNGLSSRNYRFSANYARNHEHSFPITTQPPSTTFEQIGTDNINTPTNQSTHTSHRVPTAPSQNRVPSAPSQDSFDSYQNLDFNDAYDVRRQAPPPQYADVCDTPYSEPPSSNGTPPPSEPPPPSYEDVLEHGAYRVFHV